MTRCMARVAALAATASVCGALAAIAAPHATAVDGAMIPVRSVVSVARVVSAEEIRRAGVRHWEPDRFSMSAEAGNEEGESAEAERLDELFPPGSGTGVLPPSPTRIERTQSFDYIPGSSYNFDGPVKGAWIPADPAIAAGPSGLVLATN